jgi:hypothetical protein
VEERHLVPCLLLYSGYSIPLEASEQWLLGRRAKEYSSGTIDLTPYGGYEAGVSREHALIRCRGQSFTIEDLQSDNETLLNSKRLAPGQQYPLADQDEITLGVFQLLFVLVNDTSTTNPSIRIQ